MRAILLVLLLLGLAACGGEEATTPKSDSPPAPNAEPGPLARALAERARASAEKIPPEVKALLQRAGEELEASGILEKTVGVGASAPDVSFVDAEGRSVSLDVLRATGPVVLAFYRGKW
ncbi:MAG: hypothetical protein QNJ90_14160 [Planctomycetota bacterium]|nr:hypothetical protein [Planctomycetota bacterium]